MQMNKILKTPPHIPNENLIFSDRVYQRNINIIRIVLSALKGLGI